MDVRLALEILGARLDLYTGGYPDVPRRDRGIDIRAAILLLCPLDLGLRNQVLDLLTLPNFLMTQYLDIGSNLERLSFAHAVLWGKRGALTWANLGQRGVDCSRREC